MHSIVVNERYWEKCDCRFLCVFDVKEEKQGRKKSGAHSVKVHIKLLSPIYNWSECWSSLLGVLEENLAKITAKH